MIRGDARAARAIATASPDSSLPLGDRGWLGRPVMLFSSFPSPQVPHKGRSLLLYKFDTQEYSLKHVQTL
jgi:hypothetical protein